MKKTILLSLIILLYIVIGCTNNEDLNLTVKDQIAVKNNTVQKATTSATWHYDTWSDNITVGYKYHTFYVSLNAPKRMIISNAGPSPLSIYTANGDVSETIQGATGKTINPLNLSSIPLNVVVRSGGNQNTPFIITVGQYY